MKEVGSSDEEGVCRAVYGAEAAISDSGGSLISPFCAHIVSKCSEIIRKVNSDSSMRYLVQKIVSLTIPTIPLPQARLVTLA